MTPAEMLRNALAEKVVPDPPKDSSSWADRLREINQKLREIAAAERRRAEELEAENQPPPTTPAILRDAITGSSEPVPLNGAGVLRAAIAGIGSGTINGDSE
ncbi:hypothetical protein BH11ACT6_BH11ACT6_01770 [soil metagenome]